MLCPNAATAAIAMIRDGMESWPVGEQHDQPVRRSPEVAGDQAEHRPRDECDQRCQHSDDQRRSHARHDARQDIVADLVRAEDMVPAAAIQPDRRNVPCHQVLLQRIVRSDQRAEHRDEDQDDDPGDREDDRSGDVRQLQATDPAEKPKLTRIPRRGDGGDRADDLIHCGSSDPGRDTTGRPGG